MITIEVENPATLAVVGEITETPADAVDVAVRRAWDAWGDWSRRPIRERAAFVARLGSSLRARRETIVDTIIAELGSPRTRTEAVQVDAAIAKFEAMADVAERVVAEHPLGNGVVVAESVGVVAAITPWNYPLLQIADKVAPALTAGCTVILKPSEVTPLNAVILAEAARDAGLPPDVLQVIMGRGSATGEALVSHPLVDMISFTGSTRAGRRISALAAESVKRTTMELGGKSPNVILADVDGALLQRAVAEGVASAFANSGQTCSALTRMIVPRARLSAIEQLAVDAAEAMRVGDPTDPRTQLGPLVSSPQWHRVQGFIESGLEQARLLTGGPGKPNGHERGHFARPTVFSDVDNTHRVAQEEIFGPVLSIIPVDSDADALIAANATEYGLAAGVWAADVDHAASFARRVRAGMIHVNGGDEPEGSPFGGFKQSGHGRESGLYGLREFLTTKTLCF